MSSLDSGLPRLTDERLAPVATRLTSGRLDLLTLDIFDTVLWRRVPRPVDVFLVLGRALDAEGALGPGQTAESFAAIRFQAEGQARAQREAREGNREVTLEEIMALIPASVTALDVAGLVAREEAAERGLCFANPDIAPLLDAAASAGVPVLFVSDTYFRPEFLRSLLEDALGRPVSPESVAASGVRRRSKADGLLREVIGAAGADPDRVLHVGDDPRTDGAGAEAAGVECLLLPVVPPASAAREEPVQWQARAARLHPTHGDGGLAAVRARMAATGPDDPLFRWGALVLGPLVGGLAAWATARAAARGGGSVLCLMREGQLTRPAMSIVRGARPEWAEVQASPLWINRRIALLAAQTATDREALAALLSRFVDWPLRVAVRELVPTAEVAALPDAVISRDRLAELADALAGTAAHDAILEEAARLRPVVLGLLGGAGGEPLYLLDLGYAATTQWAIQRLLRNAGRPRLVHGLYLLTATECLATQSDGGIVEGMLGQNGNPNDFVRSFCRSPEVVEIACGREDRLVGLDARGLPLLAPGRTAPAQAEAVVRVQQGALAFMRQWALTGCRGVEGREFATVLRDIATRLILEPTADEAELLAAWRYDDDHADHPPRRLDETVPGAAFPAAPSARDLASAPRAVLHWPSAAARRQGPEAVRQVRDILTRRPPPA